MTGWFFANLGWASLAMLLVLALRRPVAVLFGAGAAYALWLVPALRLVMPPLPSFAPDLPAAPETLVVMVSEAAGPLPQDAGPGQWVTVLLSVWAAGALLVLAWQFVSYRRFLTELSLSSRSIGAHRGLPLIESAAVQGPVALGLLDRRIVVPADFSTRYTPGEQRLALDHEAVHHRRGDLWWNHLGLVILALNWFNPLAWIAFRAFRADQELACDAAVAGAACPQARHDYARALIKSASRPGLIATCPLNHADQLKRRLRMMKQHKVSRLRLLGGAAAVTMLGLAGLALGSPSFAAQDSAPEAKQESGEPRDERREERVIIHTHRAGEGEHRDHAEHRRRQRSSGSAAHSEHRDHDRHVVIRTHRRDGQGGAGAHQSHRDHGVRMFNLHRGPGHGGHGGHAGHLAMADCGDGERSEVSEGEGNEQTRVILCTRGDQATPAQRAERLQRVRDRLAQEGELSAEHRARVGAALDREIARLRAQ